MNKKIFVFLKSFIISLMCSAVFVGIGYFYISSALTPVQSEAKNVPYVQQKCENAGVFLKIGQDKSFFYFDFENETVFVVLKSEDEIIEQYGYKTDFTIEANYSLLSFVVDYVGGINLTVDNKTLRYTGSQAVDLLSATANKELKKCVIEEIFKKIGQNGLALDFFANIIESFETNICIPDCYFWVEQLPKISYNLQFID